MAAKTLPQHLDAEQRVLGILFLDPKKNGNSFRFT